MSGALRLARLGVRRLLPVRLRDALKRRLYYEPAIRARGFRCERPELFEAVFFEVVTRCNSRCSFCRASLGNDPRGVSEMPFELYAKVLAELGQLGFAGRIAYHVTNEPLLFKPLESFVRHAKQALPRCRVQVMTNGLALTAKRGEALLEAGVDELVVTFYRRRPGEPLYPHLVEFRDQVLRSRFPRRRGTRYRSRDGAREVAFEVQPRWLNEVLWSRAGSAPNKTAKPDDVSGFCRFPWTQLNVTTDGRVAKCCADVLFEDPMGNLRRQSVAEVWHGETFSRVRRELWQGRRVGLPGCRSCDYFGLANKDIRNPLLLALKRLALAAY